MRRRELKKGWFKPIFICGLIIGLITIDFFIKRWVNSDLFESINVWQNTFGISFNIQYVTNRGAAWGMLASFFKPLLVIRIFVIFGLVFYLWKESFSLKKSFPFLLILAGALGNVLDSFLYDHVIDMFHFTFGGKSYGIFNLADAMIFLGCLGLIFTPKKTVHAN